MRIAYVGAGAAHMYCGSCLHANALATALIAEGQDVTLVPTYTPLRTDEPDISLNRVFLSGINIYLQHRWPALRHLPTPFHTFLESRWLLALATRMSSVTDSTGLGPLTLSVLAGEKGPQAGELTELTDFLQAHVQPDIVQLPNSMMIALAAPIRRRLGVPVLCGLQGEDLFISGLPERYQTQVRETIASRAADVDGFVATSRYGADFMADFLSLDRDRIHVVPLGLRLDGYQAHPPAGERTPAVGYMARICPEKGLHCLVEAFVALAGRRPGVRLRVAGYLAGRDEAYYAEQQEHVRAAGLDEHVDWLGEVDRQGKLDLLQSVDAFCMPTVYRESKGLPVLEALASGVPVVLPAHGAFPELVQWTDGGLLVEPDSAAALAGGLAELFDDPDRRRGLGQTGRRAVVTTFSDDAMATATLNEYERVLCTN